MSEDPEIYATRSVQDAIDTNGYAIDGISARSEDDAHSVRQEAASPPPMVNGCIPPGRWRVDRDAVRAAYAVGSPRFEIWEEWSDFTDALRQALGRIAVCWLSGSFFTDKQTPGDIDCVYFVEHDVCKAANADANTARLVGIATRNQAKQVFGIRVDTFVVERVPWDPPLAHAGSKVYLTYRGYWDELWSMMRDNDSQVAARPRRGYLEVVIDGYR